MFVGVTMAFQWAASQYIGTLKLRFSGSSALMETIKSTLPTTLPSYFTIAETSGRFNSMFVDPLYPAKAYLVVKIEGPSRNLEAFARVVVNIDGLNFVRAALLSIDPTIQILDYSIEVEDKAKTDPAYINVANRGGMDYGDTSFIEQSIERPAVGNYMNTGMSDGFYQGQDGKRHHILEADKTDQEISRILGYPYVRPENE